MTHFCRNYHEIPLIILLQPVPTIQIDRNLLGYIQLKSKKKIDKTNI